MRPILTVFAVLALMLGFVPNVGIVQADHEPTAPWLRLYQIDPRAVHASTMESAMALAFDTRGQGHIESIQVCHNSGSCSTFSPGYYLGSYRWGSTGEGWTWLTVPSGVIHAQAVMVTNEGRREMISSNGFILQAAEKAAESVWLYVSQAPKQEGDEFTVKIDRELGLPVTTAQVCIVQDLLGACQYETSEEWGMLLNGSGTQNLKLVLTNPNTVHQDPFGKLFSFPDGASIVVAYTLADGSRVSHSQTLDFLP